MVVNPRSIDAEAFSAVTKYSRQENTFEKVLLTHAWKKSSHRKHRSMVGETSRRVLFFWHMGNFVGHRLNPTSAGTHNNAGARKKDEKCDLRLSRSEKIEVSVQYLDVRD